MQINLRLERKLVELREIQVGQMFLYNVELNKDKLTLLLKTSNRNDCHEVGGFRTFVYADSTGVFPVKTLTVEY